MTLYRGEMEGVLLVKAKGSWESLLTDVSSEIAVQAR